MTTADDLVAEHMRLVSLLRRLENEASATSGSGSAIVDAMCRANQAAAAVEASARALLSASQEDAEHAAMYRWLRSKSWDSSAYDYGCTDYRFPILTRTNYDGSINHATVDAAIRAAMRAKEPK